MRTRSAGVSSLQLDDEIDLAAGASCRSRESLLRSSGRTRSNFSGVANDTGYPSLDLPPFELTRIALVYTDKVLLILSFLWSICLDLGTLGVWGLVVPGPCFLLV